MLINYDRGSCYRRIEGISHFQLIAFVFPLQSSIGDHGMVESKEYLEISEFEVEVDNDDTLRLIERLKKDTEEVRLSMYTNLG